jgi:hypothetical protein
MMDDILRAVVGGISLMVVALLQVATGGVSLMAPPLSGMCRW